MFFIGIGAQIKATVAIALIAIVLELLLSGALRRALCFLLAGLIILLGLSSLLDRHIHT